MGERDERTMSPPYRCSPLTFYWAIKLRHCAVARPEAGLRGTHFGLASGLSTRRFSQLVLSFDPKSFKHSKIK